MVKDLFFCRFVRMIERSIVSKNNPDNTWLVGFAIMAGFANLSRFANVKRPVGT
jgi:hypothetical protein